MSRLVKTAKPSAARRLCGTGGETYWARPLPGFGDPNAGSMLWVSRRSKRRQPHGAHLYGGPQRRLALWNMHRVGLANQPESVSKRRWAETLSHYVGAAVRCAPPANKPSIVEFRNCRPYLIREFDLLKKARVIVLLARSLTTQSNKC